MNFGNLGPPWALGLGLVLTSLLVRSCVSLGPYSGAGTPPKYGDFECQRHWMEVTYHLPVQDWYSPTPDNDLSWWGLDYPPLTAYWSLAWGYMYCSRSQVLQPKRVTPASSAQFINPEFVSLNTSRGRESAELKFFMRASVLAGDVLVFIPAAQLFVCHYYANEPWPRKFSALAVLVLQPALIVVDHGHFQYNSVSLGLTLAAASFICRTAHSNMEGVIAAILFTLALNYKQMSLYFAMPFFAALLGQSLHLPTRRGQVLRLALLGTAVATTCLMLWWPWLSRAGLLQLVTRIFPVGRGLYEDKVGNLWCSISPVIKLKDLYSIPFLTRLCMATTLLACLPKVIECVRHPTPRVFVHTMFHNALAFYLFSYHVHEKSVLLPALPATMLALEYPVASFVFNIVASFSMFPLLRREGLVLQYAAVLSIYTIAAVPVIRPAMTRVTCYLLGASGLGMLLLHRADALIAPPPSLPDLWTLLITSFSCFHFLAYLAVSTLPIRLLHSVQQVPPVTTKVKGS